LKPKEQDQLKQVRDCLVKMKRAGQLLVPDFKPHNVGFDKDNQLVILDFCEDREIPAFRKPLDTLLEEYADSWAEGNPSIKEYLLS